MPSLRRLIALNNQGVHALHSGRFVDAILSFRHALECIKGGIDTSSQQDASLFQPECEFNIVVHNPMYMDCLDAASLASISPNNLLDVYQCAFLLLPTPPLRSPPRSPPLPPSEQQQQQQQQQQEANIKNISNTMSIVVLYNMALAQHLAGLCGYGKVHWQQAMAYYKYAVTAFQAQQSPSPHNDDNNNNHIMDPGTVILGCITNLGHLYSHTGHNHQAQTCLHMLDQLLSTITTRSSQQSLALDESDAEFFHAILTFHTAMTTPLSVCHVCAPAA